MKIDLKDMFNKELLVGDLLVCESCLECGEYSTDGCDLYGIIVFKKGHTYFRFLQDFSPFYCDDMLGCDGDFDMDAEDCKRLDKASLSDYEKEILEKLEKTITTPEGDI